MGTVDLNLAAELRDCLGLNRAVETGTFRGDTALSLSGVFSAVVSIELSDEWHRRASGRLRGTTVQVLRGHSVEHLPALAAERVPTLYYLDGHWSGANTAGAEDECPVIEEIHAIGAGHPNDCVIIDDARLFLSSPRPPHDPAKWPTIVEVFDALREHREGHALTVLGDQVIAVPLVAKPLIDTYGRSLEPRSTLASRVAATLRR